MSLKLRECPFCGGNRVHFDTAWASSVVLIYCPDCTAIVSFKDNKRDTYKRAADAWNTRQKQIGKEVDYDNRQKA